MFHSVVGTWLPLVSIFVATRATGLIMSIIPPLAPSQRGASASIGQGLVVRAPQAFLVACIMFWTAAVPDPVSTRFVPDVSASILVYHRFGSVRDATTVRTPTFRSQLQYLKEHGYPVIPLRTLVLFLLHQGPPPPPRAVVITADDGHRSVFEDMAPLVRDFGVPVTLFIYPSAISNASYAMTWEHLNALQRTGLFDVQSHTYWHPNFNTEKQRLPAAQYREFVTLQLTKSRAILAQKLNAEVDLLAWPFGIYDDELLDLAHDCGYVAAFSTERRVVTRSERMMALPRFTVTDDDVGKSFAAMLPRGTP